MAAERFVVISVEHNFSHTHTAHQKPRVHLCNGHIV